MNAGPVLEVNTGAPRWYPAATMASFLAVIIALVVAPLDWPWSIAVLLFAAAVLWRSGSQLRTGNRFPLLRVYADFSIGLSDQHSSEISVLPDGFAWLTSRLVVIRLALPSDRRIHALVSRDRNQPASFRRFSVLCRFQFAVADGERQNGRQSNTQGA